MTGGTGRLHIDWRGWLLIGSLMACTLVATS